MPHETSADQCKEHYISGVLQKRYPVAQACPLVFDIPRSGSDYPRGFQSSASFNDVRRSVSMYVEELHENATLCGATWLFACFPNTYIDPNRSIDDIDGSLISGADPSTFEPTDRSLRGVGLIPKYCGNGGVILNDGHVSKSELKHRVDGYYKPYHEALCSSIEQLHEQFGAAFHVSCHSMGQKGSLSAPDAGVIRSDFDIGDGFGKTCSKAFVDVVQECLSGFGYNVTVNRHFSGAECIHRNAAPENGIHSLQLEINRSLYMDEDTFQKNDAFQTVKEHMTLLSHKLAKFSVEET